MGIGNYIHYWSSSYEKYGLGTNKTDKQVNVSALLNNQKQQMINQIKFRHKVNDYKGLENALNNVLYSQNNTNEQQLENLHNRTETLIGEMALKWITNFEQGGTSWKREVGETQGFHLQTIEHLKSSANNIINLLSRSSNVKDKEKRIEQLQSILKQIKDIEKQASTITKTGSNMDYVNLKKQPKLKNLISSLNFALENISVASRTQAIGASFEGLIGQMDDKLQTSIENFSYDIISDIMTGTTPTSIQGSKIDKKISKNIKLIDGSQAKINFDGNLTSSSMKMDVNLTYKDQNFRISAKNYLDTTNVHLLSDSPLLNILQKNANSNFINHFLNITTTRGEKNNLTLAHETAKFMIVLEALSGLSQKQGYSDTLVINNRSAKKIIVKPIKYFISPFQENLFKIKGYNLDTDWWYYNKWHGNETPDLNAAYVRISNLLIKLHQQKISVSMKANSLF